MKHTWIQKTGILAASVMLGAMLLGGCGESDPGNQDTQNVEDNDSSEEVDSQNTEEDSEAEPESAFLVDNDQFQLAIRCPEGVEFSRDLKADGDTELYYGRYMAYVPNVYYSTSVSEMYMDIYVDTVPAEEDPVEYLDKYTISLAMNYSDISRGDDEVHGDRTYRVLSYTSASTDGTAMTIHERISSDNGFFVMFRSMEYSGMENYISYEDMTDIFDEMYNSVLLIEK